MAVFSFRSGHFDFAEAEIGQMNLYPAGFRFDDDNTRPYWDGIANVFYQDLSSSAPIDEFNYENSLFLSWDKSKIKELEMPIPAPEEELINPPSAEVPILETEPDAGEVPSETPVESGAEIPGPTEEVSTEPAPEENNAPSPETSNSAPVDNGTTPLELLPPMEGPLEEAASNDSPIEILQEEAPIQESPADPVSVYQPEEASSLIASLSHFWQTSFKTAVVLAEPGASDGGEIFKKNIYFNNFSLPPDYEKNVFEAIELKVSLAALSANPDDRLKFFYSLKPESGEREILPLGEYRLSEAISNAYNSDYFSFDLPPGLSEEEIAGLEIGISYESPLEPDKNSLPSLFVDALWLEIAYQDDELLPLEPLPEEAIDIKEDDFELELISMKKDFKSNEEPEFNFRFREKKGIIGELVSSFLGIFKDQYQTLGFRARLLDASGQGLDLPEDAIRYLENGEFEVSVPKGRRNFRPGKYRLEINIEDKDGVFTSIEEFSWGVLALNANKSIYQPGEESYLQMAVLDELGFSVCAPEYLELEIRRPDGDIDYLSNYNGLLEYNPLCAPNNVLDEPDFFAHYIMEEEGYYDITLRAETENGLSEINDTIEVRSYVPFVVERLGPTRIYPWSSYGMEIRITSLEDFQGDFSDFVPSDFEIMYADSAIVSDENDEKRLSWAVDWKAGREYSLRYTFDAPDLSPEFYTIGPAIISKEGIEYFQEQRAWQIASDAEVGTVVAESIPISAGTTDTTNWSDVVVASSTEFTAGAKYFIYVSSGFAGNGTGVNTDFEILFGASSRFTGLVEAPGTANDASQISWFEVFDQPSTPVDITLRYRTNSGTSYALNSQIVAIKLSDLSTSDWKYAENTTPTTHTAAMVQRANMTMDIADGVKDWLVFGTEEVRVDSTNKVYMGELYNGTAASMAMSREGENADEVIAYTLYRPYDNIALNTVLSLRSRDSSTAGAENVQLRSRIFALNLSAFESYKTYYANINVGLATTPTWTEVANLNAGGNYSPNYSGEQMIFASFINDVADADSGVDDRLQVNNITVPSGWAWVKSPSLNLTSYDNIDELNQNIFAKTYVPSSGYPIDLDATEIINNAQVADEASLAVFSPTKFSKLTISADAQMEGDNTSIANGFWSNDSTIKLKASGISRDSAASLYFYYQLVSEGTTFSAATNTPSSACASGTAFNDCSTKIWQMSASTTASRASTTVSIPAVPDSSSGYKWQAIVFDERGNDSEWRAFNTLTPNFKVDANAPSVPGSLSQRAVTGSTISLDFGGPTTEINFSRYRIYFKEGTSAPTETDIEHSDANLLDIDYNDIDFTTVTGLDPQTSYTFNIWAYDESGQKASATPITVMTSAPLSAATEDQMKSNLIDSVDNGAWTNENQINLLAVSSDLSAATTAVDFYFELINESRDYTTATSVPSGACPSGTAYNDCTTKIWTVYATSTDWYSEDYKYRKKLTIKANKVTGDLLSFPVLATTTDAAMAYSGYGGHMASSSGADIAVTDSDAVTPLNFEREYYDPETGQLVLWIKTDLSSTTNKDIYLYYSNSTITNDVSTTTGVWDSDFVMVQHMDETSGPLYDSTANRNNSSLVSLVNQNASAQIDGGDEYGGTASANQVDFAASASLNALVNITAEAWVETDNRSTTNQSIISFYRVDRDRAYLYYSGATSGFRVYNDINNSNANDATTNYAPQSNEWHHVVWTINGSYWRIFIDGEERGSTARTLTMADLGTPVSTSFGSRAVNNDYQWDGTLDEARISRIERSDAWIATQYNNQKDVKSFIDISAEEASPSAFGKVNVSALPDRGSLLDNSIGYKWQVLACNASDACSVWNTYNDTIPNFKVDTVAPTAPGNLSFSTSTPTSLTIAFGATSTEENFAYYKIFYKKGLAGVTPADTEHSDDNLAYIDYNGAATTTIRGLEAYTGYVINIWAYDWAGNRTGAAEIQVMTAQTPHARGRSVMFTAGTYSANGTTGRLTDTDQTFPTFPLELAEKRVEIKDAYVIFESQLESYNSDSTDYSGYNLAFDVCTEPCTANAFSGSGRVLADDDSTLVFDETESNQLRLLFDVYDELALQYYEGEGIDLEAQIGYRLETGTASNSIANAKATLVLTYAFDDDNSENITNTVVYPLSSNGSGDSGSRRASQSDDCNKDSSCPLFFYNVIAPEKSSRLSQWFQLYAANDGHADNDININANIEGTNIDSDTYVHESANGGEQSNLPAMIFSGVNGFAENGEQTLEVHAESPGTAVYYLLGGEVFDTYVASRNAPVKTRTVSLPLGILTTGQSVSMASASIDVYFPENGSGSGVVDIKKAWFRIIANSYEAAAHNITVSSKVGENAQSVNYVYNFNSGDVAIKPSFNFIHVISEGDYSELESANATFGKNVTLSTANDSVNVGGVSAELLITYTYSSETSGYLSSLNLFGGQSFSSADAQADESGTILSVLPELRGEKTIRAGALLSSYLISDSDADMPSTWFLLGSNLAVSSPACSDDFSHRGGAQNSFSEYYRDVRSIINVNNSQAYRACYSNYNADDDSVGAKMNAILLYTYQWDAPPSNFTETNWRWYQNADATIPGPALALEKASTSNVNMGDVLRLRVNVGVSGEDMATNTQSFRLQYAEGNDCKALSEWQDVGGLAGTSAWIAYNNPSPLDGSALAGTLLSSSTVSESYEESNPSASNPAGVAVGNYGEWDWTIYNRSAVSDSSYCFRMIKGDGSEFTDYLDDSYPQLSTAPANTAPGSPSNLGQYRDSNSLSIGNRTWINESGVKLNARASDPNLGEVLTLYYEFVQASSTFTSLTSEPTGACSSGTAYDACASKIWFVSSPSGDYRYNPFVATNTILSVPDSAVGYKWQVISCDDSGACSNWVSFGTIPNFYIDSTPPTPPGNLTFDQSTPTSIRVNYGSASTETNFSRYRIFWKRAISGVTETDNEQIDPNLNYINYNGQSSTTIMSLSANTAYVINIWAYDLAGNKATATAELLASTTSSFTPPTGNIVASVQKTDGSGTMDLVIQADDPDNDDSLRARFFYSAGISCDFSAPADPTFDENDANITATYGDPDIDNNAYYQVGTSTAWIMTSPGSNFVFFDWLAKTDIPGVNDTYCLGMVLSDGMFDLATKTRLMLIDTKDPDMPGALTLNRKSYNSVLLDLGTMSGDTNFSEYKIFYKQGTSSVAITDTVFDKSHDPNLDFVDYGLATTTSIGGLLPNTDYVFNIWAFDSYGNRSSSTELRVKTNARPANISADFQYKSDFTTVVGTGAWTDENQIVLRASAHDQDAGDLLTFYYQLITATGTYITASSAPAVTCAYGTAFNACSSKVWALSTSTSLLPADWYDADWLYRKRITINASQVLANESAFPVLATTTDPLLAAYARPDGYDIIFTDASGTSTLPFEREYYGSAAGQLVAWVKTAISSTTDTVLYMYYGNSAWNSDLSTTTAVWSDNYRGVWHLSENVIDESSQSGIHLDSTLFYNHGDQYGNNEVVSRYYQGQYFDGIDDYIGIGDDASLDLTSAVSLDFWFNGSVNETSSTTTYVVTANSTFTIPDGVDRITVKAWAGGGGGGAGGSNTASDGGNGAGGAFAQATLAVTAGETLNAHVGGGGGAGIYDGATSGGGGGGGGRTEIRRNTGSLVLMAVGAGGGGGGGDNSTSLDGGNGGNGGALNGLPGSASGVAGGGGGATQTAGGAAGTGGLNPGTAGASITGGAGGDGRNAAGADGSLNNGGVTNGGDGGQASVTGAGYAAGAGGGSGYYGGGGASAGTAATCGGGGGGGSTYIIPSAVATSSESGNGLLAANNDDPDYMAGRGSGGSGGANASNGAAGGDGLIVISYSVPVNIIAKGPDSYRLMLDDSGLLVAGINNQNASTTMTSGWHHLALTYDSGAGGTEEMKLYIDGIKRASRDYSAAINANANDISLGRFVESTVDELSISSVARSQTYIQTRYNNMNSVGSFMSIVEDTPVSSYYESNLVVDIPDNPSSATGYKWQVMACDDDGDCSAWDQYSSTLPNFKIDSISPTAPGALNENNKTSNSVTLNFGSATLEDNFVEYRIYYSKLPNQGESGTMISSTSDPNLAFKNYNNASLTTISNLDSTSNYYFSIWAYDVVGHKANSSETMVTTNDAVSTPGAFFYTKNDRRVYYRLWSGNSWGSEQSSGEITTLGDNIRHIRALRSDDGGKVGLLLKTWDGTNQEWWGLVYRYAANDFVNGTRLGSAYASADNNQIMSACLAPLSGGEFIAVRGNGASGGTQVYSWNPRDSWVTENAGPDPGAVLNACELIRRPGTDNYLLMTFDDDADVGSSYYYGGAAYSDTWTTWTQHSSDEEDTDNFVGEAVFDPSDNSRGIISFSNSSANNYTYAKYFVCSSNSINYGSQTASPATAPDDWGNDFVHGEIAADPGATGISYYAGRDTGGQLNVYKINASTPTISWSTLTNGDNVSGSVLYSETNDAQKPFAIRFYRNGEGVLSWLNNTAATPKYRKIVAGSGSVDASDTAVPGAASNIYPRVRFYNDPNVEEMLAVYENDDIDYSAVFWNGGSDEFYAAGNQAWTELVTASGAADADDEKTVFAFTGYNSAPNAPNNLLQYRQFATSSLPNQAWISTSTVELKASVTDFDTSERLSLYVQLIADTDTFSTTTDGLASACSAGTSYSACASKIWFVASSTGDFSYTPFTATATIAQINNSSIGYKWQMIACDDEIECSAWSKFNVGGPNFKVDTLAPTAPGALSIGEITSKSITLNFGTASVEDNFQSYEIRYKAGSSGVLLSDLVHSSASLLSRTYAGATTTIVLNLASSTQYVFNIWAFDRAGNMATATPEISTTTRPSAYLTQTSYLIENDDGATVNINTAEVAVDTALSGTELGERMNVRIQVDNSGGDQTESLVYRLQFENQTDSPGTWTDVGDSSQIAYSYGLSGSNGQAITSAKAAANTGWVNGTWHENTRLSAAHVLPKDAYTEFVFAVRTGNALAGKTYRLRLYNETAGRVLESYTLYPTILTVASSVKKYSKESLAAVPNNRNDLRYFLDREGYDDVLYDDSNLDQLPASAESPVYMFATKHTNNTDAASSTWNGRSTVAASSSNVFLQVYRFGTTNAWVTLDTESSAGADTDFELLASLNSNMSEYYGVGNWIYWRVYQSAISGTFSTDYYKANFAPPLPFVSQIHSRWREDNGTEATATWREAEDVGSPTSGAALGKGSTTRLRIEVANTGGGTASNYAYQLEYASSSDACTSNFSIWNTVPVTAGTEPFEMATSSYFTDGDSTSARLANTEAYTFIDGDLVEDPSDSSGAISLAERRYTEIEYMFSVTSNAIAAETYCFRVTDSGSELDAYSRYPAATIGGSNNNAPYFDVLPSDNGSSLSIPTNEGSNVAFTARADDDEGDSYYLAVCKTAAITPGNNTAPTCGGGAWCISGATSAGGDASCNYLASSTSPEQGDWYAYVCDLRSGFGVSACSAYSQGSGSVNNDSPLAVNHRPSFSSVTTLVPSQNPGATFNINTVSADTDSAVSADTLYLYVCKTADANFSGCVGGVSDTVCSAIATSSPNASCSFTDIAPTPSGSTTYYAYLFDSHGLGASSNYLSSSYAINNVTPIFGDLVLNDRADISPNIRGGADVAVTVVSSSTVDMNGCTDISSAVGSVYISNVASGPTCSPNDNYCYQITTSDCVISACDNDEDSSAIVTCTTYVKYHMMPTDDFSNNPALYWLGYMQLSDGANMPTITSDPVDVTTNMALDVVEDVINFGNNMYAGDDTGAWNATTTVVNSGNSPIDTILSGTNMDSPGYSIPVNSIEYSLNNFSYTSGVDLTILGENVDIFAPRPTSVATTSDQILWGLGVPYGADASNYQGYNTFTVTLDGDSW